MRCIKAFPEHFCWKLGKDANFTPLKVSNEWGKVGKYITKSFGVVDFSYIAEILGTDIKYDGHRINLHFDGDYINQKIIDTCLHTVNNYFEINNTIKQAMLTAFQENKSLHDFFEYCYENFPRYESVRIFGAEEFEVVNMENVVEKLKYPDLRFTMDNNGLAISLWYHFESASSPAKSNALIVTMSEQLNILSFEHGEHLIS